MDLRNILLPYGESQWNRDSHYENMPIQMQWNFYHQKKNENFQIKISDIFHISAQNRDCGTR